MGETIRECCVVCSKQGIKRVKRHGGMNYILSHLGRVFGSFTKNVEALHSHHVTREEQEHMSQFALIRELVSDSVAFTAANVF